MQLYLTPVAIGYLTQLILVTLISGYFFLLSRQPRRDPRVIWLTGFFFALTGFIIMLFLEAALLPTYRLYAVFMQNPLLGVALTCLLQFAYHFSPRIAAQRREARVVLALSGLYTLWELGYALFRFAQLHAGHVLYRFTWSDYALLLLLLWVPLSFYRHTRDQAPGGRSWTRWIKPFLPKRNDSVPQPTTRDARAARGFALIFLFVASLSVFNILRSAYLLSVALANLGISLGMLVALFSFAVTYLNYHPGTTSFRVKLVGVTLTVMLAIMGVVGWSVSPFYEEHYHLALPDQRTLRFTPNEALLEDSGYTLSEIPFTFARERGRKLDLTEDAARTCSPALDFTFPFYGQSYSHVYACNDGTVSFGQAMTYRMYQYRYGAGAPLILPLLTDLYPEISHGGVFVQQEAARLVITWERMRGFKQQEIEFTFQAVLYPSGVFDFSYASLPERLVYHPNDDPGASVWAIGALPGGLEQRAGPQLITLTDVPLTSGPDGVLADYHLEFRQYLHRLLAPLTRLILIASASIVGGFPLLFQTTLVTPLNALLRGVRRMEAGDYTGTVPMQHADEIGYLTEAFNTLAAQLGDLIHNLEARVTARTEELDAANVQLRAEIVEREQAQATIIEQQRELAAFEERERLARNLHDGQAQLLGYLNVQTQAVETLLVAGDLDPARANLQRMAQTVYESQGDLRNYIMHLRTGETAPPQDFWQALRQSLQQFQTTYNIETRLSLPTDTARPMFGPVIEDQLLHIIQEALTNARKHANAQQIEVFFSFTETLTHVTVIDDGCGFETPLHPPREGDRGGSPHFGLEMMQERARMAGGQVEVRSSRGHGTRVLVQIPNLNAPDDDTELDALLRLRILLVDDHPLFMEGLHSMLSARGFIVVGAANDGASALRLTRALRPHVVLMDMHMPGSSGLEATRAIKAEMPDIKVVMLTFDDRDEYIFKALKSGASGYLLKRLKAREFCTLLARVLRDDVPLAPGLAARIVKEFAQSPPANSAPAISPQTDPQPRALPALTDRQNEILRLVAQGLTYKQVGQSLHLNEKTIKYHMTEIRKQLHLKNRAQAIAYYQQQTHK